MEAAVTTLPAAPLGYTWELITPSPLIDREVIDTSPLESAIENDLGFGSSSTDGSSTIKHSSRNITFDAFGSPEPDFYSQGNIVQVVLSNDLRATFGICTSAGAMNSDQDVVFLQNVVRGVSISTQSAISPIVADHKDALEEKGIIVTQEPAHATTALALGLGEIEGQVVTVDFSSTSEVKVTTPFGREGTSDISYFGSPIAEATLVRETQYQEYRLVALNQIPEPASLIGICISSVLLLKRRRN
ncbi:MAG: PEP-CTERM sorting domain-containing protein [Verrucomicrobiaceae bacterium]